MINPSLLYFSCGNGCNSHFQVIRESGKVDQKATAELLQEHLQICTKQAPCTTDPNASIDPSLVAPETPIISTGSVNEAYFRNSLENDTQVITTRIPLIIDGLYPTSFNHFDWNIWDVEQSKIIASKLEESYITRVIFRTTSNFGSVITLDFDGGGDVGIIYEKTFQPTQLTEARNCETVTFFVNPSILENGCQINVRASEETLITKPSLYLRW